MAILQKATECLLQGKHTVTCAESCTGGLLAAALTSLPGSTAWFEMSFVTYSNESKQRLLGVSADSLKCEGAVSETVAGEMAAGALSASGADFALSISGIAGPGGGSAEKPVGMVCFGLADKRQTHTATAYFSGSRSEIRTQAVNFALTMLHERLIGDIS